MGRPGHTLFFAAHGPLVAGYWPLATGSGLLGDRLLATRRRQRTAGWRLFPDPWSLISVLCSLFLCRRNSAVRAKRPRKPLKGDTLDHRSFGINGLQQVIKGTSG